VRLLRLDAAVVALRLSAPAPHRSRGFDRRCWNRSGWM